MVNNISETDSASEAPFLYALRIVVIASAEVAVSVTPPIAALADTFRIFIASAPSCPADTI